ncbi:lipid-A-disaccharide synthase [Thiogranum longum]|uniref:Lipid-A-disaccharide synthase n=1 Tax=Thiogranum longum TaxID=1537524 RepID=A0A4R1H998_9GAMM|nr:lipid-A-disaccharide synthase [Thiogranum longum]TCK18444.1 lipid-A-disaccharide synthase [Thiogranum longum]
MTRQLRIGLVAGEVSGDQLGASLIHAIRERYPKTVFEGVAGPEMREAGCTALADIDALSVMGLAEVLGRLPSLVSLRRRLRRHFMASPPDVFVGIDAPDFNLGLEAGLKRAGIPVVHWVSPSVWAWRQYRVRKIGRSVDLMLTLFPFEEQFYRQHDIASFCTGHPLADDIPERSDPVHAQAKLGLQGGKRYVGLLPGSRRSEVARLLPVFLEAAQRCRQLAGDIEFLIPAANKNIYRQCQQVMAATAGCADLSVTLFEGQAREVIQSADAILLASGTAALECLLVGRPMLVAYRLHPLSAPLAKRLLETPYVSLPNHLLGRMQVPEYLQQDVTPSRLAEGLLALLQDPERAAAQVAPFSAVHRDLKRGAAARAAQYIVEIASG